MADAEQTNQKAIFEVRATAESHFSWLRTHMSLERTLMSWADGYGADRFRLYDLSVPQQIESNAELRAACPSSRTVVSKPRADWDRYRRPDRSHLPIPFSNLLSLGKDFRPIAGIFRSSVHQEKDWALRSTAGKNIQTDVVPSLRVKIDF